MTTAEHTTTKADLRPYPARHARTEAGWTDRTDPDHQGRHRATRVLDLIRILKAALPRATA